MLGTQPPMLDENQAPRFIVLGDSTKSNALGRAQSMVITASVLGPTELFVVDDGPVWVGAPQLGDVDDIKRFRASRWRKVARQLRRRSTGEKLVVWTSKGTFPLDKIVRYLRKHSSVLVISDFDDDDVAIMKNFISLSATNRLKMPVFRRKHPIRLARSQKAGHTWSHGQTYSSPTLRNVYWDRYRIKDSKTAVVPHTRRAEQKHQRDDSSDSLRIGFLGTIRAHKGVDEIVNLANISEKIEIFSFEQAWTPPASLASRWHQIDPLTPLHQAYAMIDFLILPMRPGDPAAAHQLPAKLVDAAQAGCPVVATPTDVIQDFVAGSYIAIPDWSDAHDVLTRISGSDRRLLSRSIFEAYLSEFSPEATAEHLDRLLKILKRENL